MKTSHRQTGFTLLELLIVIAILGLLVSIIVPSLSRAKDLAKRVICLSNLHQMGLAANVYTTDYNESYPIAQYSASDGVRGYAYAWDLTTICELTKPGKPKTVVPGLLWYGRGPMAIQQCPSFAGAANWGVDPFTGYNYNTSYIGRGQGEFGEQDSRGIVRPARTNEIKNPGSTVIFGDGQYSGGANKFMRAPWPHPGEEQVGTGIRSSGTQGFRHLGTTNVAFCDGHAVTLSERFTDTEEGAARVAPGTGFLSKDNSMYGSSSPVVDGWVAD